MSDDLNPRIIELIDKALYEVSKRNYGDIRLDAAEEYLEQAKALIAATPQQEPHKVTRRIDPIMQTLIRWKSYDAGYPEEPSQRDEGYRAAVAECIGDLEEAMAATTPQQERDTHNWTCVIQPEKCPEISAATPQQKVSESQLRSDIKIAKAEARSTRELEKPVLVNTRRTASVSRPVPGPLATPLEFKSKYASEDKPPCATPFVSLQCVPKQQEPQPRFTDEEATELAYYEGRSFVEVTATHLCAICGAALGPQEEHVDLEALKTMCDLWEKAANMFPTESDARAAVYRCIDEFDAFIDRAQPQQGATEK